MRIRLYLNVALTLTNEKYSVSIPIHHILCMLPLPGLVVPTVYYKLYSYDIHHLTLKKLLFYGLKRLIGWHSINPKDKPQ